MKKLLPLIFAIIMVAALMPLSAFAEEGTTYQVGDHIEFGNYPQTLETDEEILALLDSMDKDWISYNYYSGTGLSEDGKMSPSDYMFYCDLDTNDDGLRDYRAVRIDDYRSFNTGDYHNINNSFQDDNGYTAGNVYYFRFEPISWRILDPTEGLILTEQLIDNQAYNNFVLRSGTVTEDGSVAKWGDAEMTFYANDYYNSSVRQWLNDDFYNTAFNSTQVKNISKDIALNNNCYDSSLLQYNSQSCKDKIFPLSYDEVKNSRYGFDSSELASDVNRTAYGTDYAKAQGLCLLYGDSSGWLLRSPGNKCGICSVSNGGYCYNNTSGINHYNGIRVACRLSALQSDVSQTAVKNYVGLGLEDYEDPCTHSNTEIQGEISATCTVAGYTGDKVCSDCGETLETGSVIETSGHNEITTKTAQTPAYHKNGRTEEISCSVCNEILTPSRVVNALNYYFEVKDGNLNLYGDGKIPSAPSYGLEGYERDIYYAQVNEPVSNVPSGMIADIPYLGEVYLDNSVTLIEENAFTNCLYLSVVTFRGNTEIEENAFSGCSSNLTFVCPADATNVIAYAKRNNINLVTFDYNSEKAVLSFNGTISVFDNIEYKFLNKILSDYPDTIDTFFKKLIFTNAESGLPFDETDLDIEYIDDNIIVNNVYVRISVVTQNGERDISFEEMQRLLESGEYDSFKVTAKSDEKTEDNTIIKKPSFADRILQLVSKLINFIKRLFSK